MSVTHLEILVEERSMEAFLQELLPRTLPEGSTFSIFTHEGKADLLNKLPSRLNGYSKWLPPNYGIVVIVDRDADDAAQLKKQIESCFLDNSIVSKTQAEDDDFAALSRIAIEEPEAWYFGNWEATCRSFPRLPTTVPQRAKYRNSDEITGGTWEAFERECKNAGYFSTGLRKVEAARMIGREIRLAENRSPSFAKLTTGLSRLLGSDLR